MHQVTFFMPTSYYITKLKELTPMLEVELCHRKRLITLNELD